jgi:Flp pilus assembly pilin Flp
MRKLDERGQGMTEYIILVALIAVAAIAAVKYFGSKTKEGFQNAAEAVGGATAPQGGGSLGNQAKQAGTNFIADQASKALNR